MGMPDMQETGCCHHSHPQPPPCCQRGDPGRGMHSRRLDSIITVATSHRSGVPALCGFHGELGHIAAVKMPRSEKILNLPALFGGAILR